MSRLAAAGVAALLVAFAAPAGAHRLSPAYFGLTESTPGVFDARFKVSISGGLADALSPQIPEPCRVDGVRGHTVDDARVQIGTVECGEASLRGAKLEVAGLARTDTDVLVRIDWLDGTSFTHRLVPEAPDVTIPERAGSGEVAATYLGLGVEHILLGIDHLLFVLALLMLVEGFGRLVATVTAFTVAHSITLGAATLGLVTVPSAAVEATIALSILFLATELARHRKRVEPQSSAGDSGWAPGRDDLATRFPWIVAFAFGLLHGFGFAGALTEIGMPEGAIPIALLFFNVGVELGQLAFVGVFAAGAALITRAAVPVPALVRPAAVYGIGCVSAYWVFERTLTAL